MLSTLAFGIVLMAGLYLVSLAAVAILAPARAVSFLLGFAGSARLHYLELALRCIAGTALVLRAPQMRFADAFAFFGYVLLLTTAGLILVPWHWHRTFAERAVPRATRHLAAVGVASLALGVLILVAALTGTTA